ncbi:HK97-gp10 family putative phage morphogenesis protein [Pseudoponticoccus marisrubri]|uniref:HK97 gp10 family phage protein n=1 Tax=Pseudoponticoccus marisrubri TaxID=1685382 RepID=A0A0W7WPH0_9RHOB|nr:HK97-gp10 family putative phage morphogenesis protein [Pseudoponticoccus marisrubri]KUF12407.1 hypothetical protein AVJ23_01360 [Pseudoponticoccus marisrubri]
MSLRDDSKRLERRLEAIPQDILHALRPALVKSAEETARNARTLAPVEDGDLAASITVTGPNETTPAYAEGGGKRTAGPNQALVTVGNENVRHGHLQEFGTIHHEAQPFLRPGWRIARPRVMRRIQRAITTAIRKAGK